MRNSPFEDLLAICGPPEGTVPLWTLVRPTRARDASVLAPPPGLHRPQEDSPQIQEVCPRISCGLPLPWEDTKFLRHLLPKQVHRMLSRAAVETATKGSTPRAAFETAVESAALARERADLASQLATAERERFSVGASNLILVNLREVQAAKDRKDAIDADIEQYRARARLRFALGTDPLSE